MRGPWSRAVLAEVAGDIRPTSEVDSLEIKPGTVVGHVGECTVTLRTERVPPRIWAAMVSLRAAAAARSRRRCRGARSRRTCST